MNLLTEQKETYRLREGTYNCRELGGTRGGDSQGVWNGHVQTTVFKIDNQQGLIVQHMELYSMLCGSLDGRGRMDTSRYMLSPFAVYLNYQNIVNRLLIAQSLSRVQMDCSSPGCSAHGISQARILERIAMPSSKGSSRPKDRTPVSFSPALAGGFFTTSTIWGSPQLVILQYKIKKFKN